VFLEFTGQPISMMSFISEVLLHLIDDSKWRLTASNTSIRTCDQPNFSDQMRKIRLKQEGVANDWLPQDFTSEIPGLRNVPAKTTYVCDLQGLVPFACGFHDKGNPFVDLFQRPTFIIWILCCACHHEVQSPFPCCGCCRYCFGLHAGKWGRIIVSIVS
jgi:hypothetical protein